MNTHKKWTLVFLSSFLFLLMGISIFNLKVDSLGIFSVQNYLRDASNAVLDGKMIAGLANYDERSFQKLLITKNQKKMDYIVLGSSRSMLIRKQYVTGDESNFYNHAVSGASLEDYMAIIGMYEKEKGYLPQNVLIGIDAFVFNGKDGETRWYVVKDYYLYLLKKLSLPVPKEMLDEPVSVKIKKLKELISWDNTSTNWSFFYHALRGKNLPFTLTDTIEVDNMVLDTDGSRYWPYSNRKIDPEYARNITLDRVKAGSAAEMDNFEMANQEKFKVFIRYLIQNHVKVKLYLPPYQPDAYIFLLTKPKFKNVLVIEGFLRNFAKDEKLEVYGSYDPAKNGLTYKEFVDEIHPREIVPQRLLSGSK